MKELQRRIGYQFQNESLLRTALTHSSYANEQRDSHYRDNERLEFLGDAVLGFVSAEYLFRKYGERQEGDLTRIRADLVCETNLARAAEKIGLGDALLLGRGEDAAGGRHRNSIVSDAMEAVFAAIYLDGGMNAVKGAIERLILSDAENVVSTACDFKTKFQELVQRKKNQSIHYVLVGASGPDHDKHFEMEIVLNGQIVGTGSGSSKKKAEQEAAKNAIMSLFPDEFSNMAK